MARRATRQIELPTGRAAASAAARKPSGPPPPGRTPAQPAKPAAPKSSRKSAAPIAKPRLDGLTAEQKVAALLKERNTLVTRLLAAEGRVVDLEAREAQLADRISWALDTLNDLLRLSDAS